MPVKIVAHRGESVIAPENTVEAFALAWARGASCIEGDFHLTKDGEIVCMHDDNCLRTCGVNKSIAELTLAEIRNFDAGLWKGDAWRYTRVPTLREVLETMPEHGEIFIELKSVGPIVDVLKAVFASGPWRPEQLTFIAFDEATVSAVKQLFPSHKAHWLTCNWTGDWQNHGSPQLSPAELVAKLRALGVDGVDICATDFLDKSYGDALHAANLGFHVWTVDDPAEAKRMLQIGVDSITTNRARFISEELSVSTGEAYPI